MYKWKRIRLFLLLHLWKKKYCKTPFVLCLFWCLDMKLQSCFKIENPDGICLNVFNNKYVYLFELRQWMGLLVFQICRVKWQKCYIFILTGLKGFVLWKIKNKIQQASDDAHNKYLVKYLYVFMKVIKCTVIFCPRKENIMRAITFGYCICFLCNFTYGCLLYLMLIELGIHWPLQGGTCCLLSILVVR